MREKGRLSILKNWRSIEQVSYFVVWSVLIFLPLIFWDFSDSYHQARIVGGWVRILPFFLIFIIHNLILLPHLLLKKHYLAYAIATLILILLINYWFVFSEFLHENIFRLFIENSDSPGEGAESMRGQGRHFRGGPGRGRYGKGMGGFRYWSWHGTQYLIYTYNILISLLIIGFNTALKFGTQWLKQEQVRKETEKQAIESQLTALQNQVSPHFFMNTLNNIHALIDYNSEDAKEAVLRLSKMMRYLLYESDSGKTLLTKEIEFLKSYIELMKLRIQPGVDLKIEFPDSVPGIEVYSLITISFLENAFKHGIDPKGKSFIHILLELTNNKIHFNTRNSKILSTQEENEKGGIGIENARKRLELIYGKNFSLNIYNRSNEFEVDLIYPLS